MNKSIHDWWDEHNNPNSVLYQRRKEETLRNLKYNPEAHIPEFLLQDPDIVAYTKDLHGSEKKAFLDGVKWIAEERGDIKNSSYYNHPDINLKAAFLVGVEWVVEFVLKNMSHEMTDQSGEVEGKASDIAKDQAINTLGKGRGNLKSKERQEKGRSKGDMFGYNPTEHNQG